MINSNRSRACENCNQNMKDNPPSKKRGTSALGYNTPVYRRSRFAYIVQCTVEYFISILLADAFLAKLLSSIGINDSIIGIISSFISLGALFQLVTVAVMTKKINVKKFVVIGDTISILFFTAMYLIPFIPLSVGFKTILTIVCVLVGYFIKFFIFSIHFNWANSYVEPKHRARYSAAKEIISLLGGLIFTAVMGYIIDKYESIGNLNGSFLFIAVTILILNICNFISWIMVGGKSESISPAPVSVSEVTINIIKNRNFQNVVIMTVLWDVARYFTIGFLGIFKTKDLLISVFAIQLINMIARMVISHPFGKYSDKHSYAKGFELAMIVAAVSFFINIFTTKSTWYLIIIYTILYNCSLAGSNQNSYNIIYSYVEPEYIPQAMAIKNSICGVCGFIASVFGGKILAAVQANNNIIFGIHIYGQQLLSAISCILTTAVVVFIHKIVRKQTIMIN